MFLTPILKTSLAHEFEQYGAFANLFGCIVQ
jgi:hypothetical protein